MGNRVVVITGAAAGVGRAIAHRFAKSGAKLGLIARDGEALAQVKTEIEAKGTIVSVFAVDVSDAEALFAAADEIASTLGPIEVWVNDAMLTVFSPVAKITLNRPDKQNAMSAEMGAAFRDAVARVNASDVPLDGLSKEDVAKFNDGDALFGLPFRPADGLGPLFIRTACVVSRAVHSSARLRATLARIASLAAT